MIKDDYWTMVEKEERALSEKEYERIMMELEIEDALEDGRIERIGKMDITDTGINLIGEARGSVADHRIICHDDGAYSPKRPSQRLSAT